MNKKQTYDTILIATHNQGKLAELKKNLSDLPYQFVSLNDVDVGITHDVAETGTTFEQNALLKARDYARLSGLPTIADDGGLVIDALDGWPGVYSARIAGDNAPAQQKVAMVLERMKHIPDNQRTAHFVNVNALVFPDPAGATKVFNGSIDGSITQEPRGALIKGLQYRVIFLLPEFGKTMAELDAEGIIYKTHRQKAVEQLIEFLQK